MESLPFSTCCPSWLEPACGFSFLAGGEGLPVCAKLVGFEDMVLLLKAEVLDGSAVSL